MTAQELPDWSGQNRPIYHPERGGDGYWMIQLMECFLEHDEDTVASLLPEPSSYGWEDEFMDGLAWEMHSYDYAYFVPNFYRFGCLPTWFPEKDREGRKLTPQGQIDRFLYLVDFVYGGLPQDHRQVNPKWLAEAILELYRNDGYAEDEDEDGLEFEQEQDPPAASK
jgi:hypothetical protein